MRRSTKNIHDIDADVLRDMLHIRITCKPVDLGMVWIHGNHRVPDFDQISTDGITRTGWIVRTSDHSNGLGGCQNIFIVDQNGRNKWVKRKV